MKWLANYWKRFRHPQFGFRCFCKTKLLPDFVRNMTSHEIDRLLDGELVVVNGRGYQRVNGEPYTMAADCGLATYLPAIPVNGTMKFERGTECIMFNDVNEWKITRTP